MLEQLSCNAKLTGVVYDRTGKPIWRTESRRTVTESQWQLLIAKWGGCFHCGANPGICQGHHIEPASRGGPTKLDNLVPACWTCHHRIHHDGWQIHKRPDGNHTLHPPDTVRFGPARAPDHAPVLFKPDTQHDPDPPPIGRVELSGVTCPGDVFGRQDDVDVDGVVRSVVNGHHGYGPAGSDGDRHLWHDRCIPSKHAITLFHPRDTE